MSEPSNLPGKPTGERQRHKFNRDVLPEFKRRSEMWDVPGEKARGEGTSDVETDSIFKWVGFGILLVLVAAVVGVTLHRNRGGGAADDAAEPGAAQLLRQQQDAVEQVVRDYMATESVGQRLKFVRRADVVAPLMENYYRQHELYPLKVWSYELVAPRVYDGREFWRVVVNTPESSEALDVEQTSDGLRVDWETHVGLNPMPPEQFLRERPVGIHDFRVYASPDDYYNGEFADQEKYAVAKLEFANSPVVIFGYIERTSPDFTRFFDLVNINPRNAKPVPLVLRLEWPQPAAASAPPGQLPQVHIRKLVAARWLILD